MNTRASAVAILFVVTAFATVPTLPEDAVKNQAVVKQMSAAINDRDLDALDYLVANDIHRHSAATPGVVVKNLDQFKAFLKQDFAAVRTRRG